jgi:L-asparaginase
VASLLKTRPRVHVIGTGGSIAGVGDDRVDYTEYAENPGRFSIHQLLDRVPEAREIADLTVEEFANVGSTSLAGSEWVRLARRINDVLGDPEVAGVFITHGTATLEETAYFLNLTVKSDRPVVITGAMRPPTALGTDADINILDGISLAASREARGKGVLTVLNNEIQAAREVTKTNTYRLETFRSPEFGFLGYVDADHRVVFYRAPTRRHTHQSEFDVAALGHLPRVDIVYTYAGADGDLVRHLADRGVDGIVVAGVGAGRPTPGQMDALIEARHRGILVAHSSRLGSGRVVVTRMRAQHGFIAADDLNPQKARILLMLGLTVTRDVARLQEMFATY